jgi:hypothetical protein
MMKSFILFGVVLIWIFFLVSCDTKNTIHKTPDPEKSNNGKGEMVVDGVIQPGAKLACSGVSGIEQWIYVHQEKSIQLTHAEVFWVLNETTQEKELHIWMDNERDGIEQSDTFYFKFILSGIASPVKPCVFSFVSNQKEKAKGFVLLGEEVVEEWFETTNGQITIESYGMSSNVICGTISVSSTSGSQLKAIFNAPISSF